MLYVHFPACAPPPWERWDEQCDLAATGGSKHQKLPKTIKNAFNYTVWGHVEVSYVLDGEVERCHRRSEMCSRQQHALVLSCMMPLRMQFCTQLVGNINCKRQATLPSVCCFTGSILQAPVRRGMLNSSEDVTMHYTRRSLIKRMCHAVPGDLCRDYDAT